MLGSLPMMPFGAKRWFAIDILWYKIIYIFELFPSSHPCEIHITHYGVWIHYCIIVSSTLQEENEVKGRVPKKCKSGL